MTAALIVSLSETAESSLSHCTAFATELDARLVPASWLLPPRPREGRHLPDGPVIRWLRSRVQVGDALVLHGFDHTVAPAGRGRLGRRAEFAVLPSHEATLRLIAAARTMDELGLPSDVFAPPRWLASAGTVVALRRRGFRICADGTGVRLLDQPGDLGRMLRGRVLTAGVPLPAGGVLGGSVLGGSVLGGSVLGALPENAETWRQRSQAAEAWRQRSQAAALVRTAGRTARRGGLVRLTVGASDLTKPAIRQTLLAAIDAALAEGAVPVTYRMPIPDPAPLSA